MSKSIVKKFAFAVLILVSAVCIAAEDVPPQNNGSRRPNFGGERGNWGGNRGNRGNRGNWGGNRGNRSNRGPGSGNFMELMPLMSSAPRILAFEAIREKFPKESAELDKLILENEAKYAELAKKSGTEMPVSIECQLIKLRNADPAGYAEAFKAVKSNPRTGMRKLLELAKKHNIALSSQRRISMPEGRNVQAPSANRAIQRPDFRKLRAKYPEDMEKYESLRQSDPEQARKLLADMMKRLNDESEKK